MSEHDWDGTITYNSPNAVSERLQKEIERLSAELASRQIDIDTFREGNQKLRAELAEARRALLAGNDTVLANKKLQEDNAAKDARIAELEAAGNRLGDAAIAGILDGRDRAERAEAERDAMREVLEEFCYAGRDELNDCASDLWVKARAVLAPFPAGDKR